MKKALAVVLFLGVVVGVGLVAAAAVLSARWREEFTTFDAWDAEGARVARALELGPGRPFECTSKPTSEDPGKAFFGVVEFAGSLRPADGVVLPFADKPRVVYFGPHGLQARRSTVEVYREVSVGTGAAARALLASPGLLKDVRSPPPRLRVPAMGRDVDVTVLVRSVEEREGEPLLLRAELAITTPGRVHCQGQLEIPLGAESDRDDLRVKHLSQVVQRLLQDAPPRSPEPAEVNQR